eukprot:gene6635-7380_t
MKRLFLASEAVMILLLAFFKNSVTVCKESQRYLKQKSYLSCGNRSFNRKLQCQDLLEYYKPANHPHLPKKYNVSVEAPAAKMQLLKETHVKDDLYVNTKPQHQTMPSWSKSKHQKANCYPHVLNPSQITLIADVQKDPENVFVPEEFSAENESVTVWDHIDNLEDTRSGAGYFGELEPYIFLKRQGAGKLTFPLEENSYAMLISQSKKYLLWTFACYLNLPKQIALSWTGFFICVRDNMLVLKSTVGYFQSTDAPTTEMSTVFEILKRSCALWKSEAAICCMLYRAIYSKACEIVWKRREMFQDVVLMLGNFHLMVMYLDVIGKCFGDAGLRDVMVQSDVITQGSVDKALSGHMYNRAVLMQAHV